MIGSSGKSKEQDPHGKQPNEPGAKLDYGKLRPDLVLGGFSQALEEVVLVGTYGAQKYSDNGWSGVPDGVARYTDAMMRHYLEEKKHLIDSETGMMHGAQLAWNALARLELLLRHNFELSVLREYARRGPGGATSSS